MFEQYKIGVTVSLHDGVTGAISLIARHFGVAEGAAAKLEKRMASIKSLFAGGAVTFGVGAAIAAPLLYATDKAAELQKQLIGIQIATRGSAAEMTNMRKAIEGIAGQTIFSNIDVAKQAKLIATGTGFGANQVSSLLPVFAKFADVQMLMKGTGYEESVTNLIRLAHTAQHYDPKSLGAYADLLTKASFIVPGGLGEVGHALKYSQGVAKTALGVDDEQAVLMTALLNRLGLSGSRGGTNLIAAMSRTIPGVFGSGLLTGKSAEALAAMGMVDAKGHAKVFKDGKFDVVTWMGLMGDYVQREFASHPEAIARQDIMKNFQHAYGVQGSRVATLLSNPQAIEQFLQIGKTFAQYGGVEGMQQQFANESVAQQWENAKTNFISAMTELGYTLLPTATKYLKEFNTYMAKVIDWMEKNPEAVKEYATNIGLLAAAFIGLSIVSSTTASIMTLSTAVGALGAAASGKGGGGLLGRTAAAIPLAGAVYEGAHAFGEWVDSKFDVGDYWSNKATEWFNPEFSKFDINHPTGHSAGKIDRDPYIRPGGGVKVYVNVNNKIDRYGLTTAVTQEQSKWASGPNTGGSLHDPRASMIPAGGY